MLNNIVNNYKMLLHWALCHRILVIAASLILLIGSIALIPFIGTELMPEVDEAEVRVNGEMEVGIGESGEAQQVAMARAVIGGLFSSTLITLFIVPVIYSIAERKKKLL